MVWALRDAYIGNTFFDANASAFLLAAHAHRFYPVPPIQPVDGGDGVAEALSRTSLGHGGSGSGGGIGAEAGPVGVLGGDDVYDWHTDAPLPPHMQADDTSSAVSAPAHRHHHHQHSAHDQLDAAIAAAGESCATCGGGSVVGGGGEEALSADAAQTASSMAHGGGGHEVVELVPVYDPLPPRTRSRRKRGTEGGDDGAGHGSGLMNGGSGGGGGGGGGVSDGEEELLLSGHVRARDRSGAGPGFRSSLPDGPSDGGDAGKRARREEEDSGSPAWQRDRRTYGSCLGPGWLTAMAAATSAAAAAAPPSVAGAGSPQPRVHCEMRCEVTHVMNAARHGPSPTASVVGRWIVCDHTTDAAAAEAVRELPSLETCQRVHGAWPVYVRLSNGHVWGADVVLSATGAAPAFPFLPLDAGAMWPRGGNGGLLVDSDMRVVGQEDVYACGDAASIEWPQRLPRYARAAAAISGEDPTAEVPLWFQMRLWNQARNQGIYTARSMVGMVDELERDDGGVAFELFAHMTRFLGFKVVLLGLYNGQGLGAAYEAAVRLHIAGSGEGGASADSTAPPGGSVELHFRTTPGGEYVKLVLVGGRLVGALLVGDTGLEETMENLMMNRLPLDGAGTGDGAGGGSVLDLLNPAVDVDDYFD